MLTGPLSVPWTGRLPVGQETFPVHGFCSRRNAVSVCLLALKGDRKRDLLERFCEPLPHTKTGEDMQFVLIA